MTVQKLDFLQLRIIRDKERILIEQHHEQVEITRPMLQDVIQSLCQIRDQIDTENKIEEPKRPFL